MCSYAVLGVIVLIVCGYLPVSSCEQCNPNTDIKVMQTKCREPNEALLAAEQKHKKDELCRQLFLLLKCVATNVTQCFDYFHDLNSQYFHSPHNCILGEEQIRELQEIHNNKTRVSIVPLPPSTKKSEETTPSSTSFTTQGKEGEDSEAGGGGTVGHEGGTTQQEGGAKGGKREEHKGSNSEGNAASRLYQNSMRMLLLVLASMSLSWRLTS